MAVWMDRSTVSFSQMGGEGVSWVGRAPFDRPPHLRQPRRRHYKTPGLLAVRQSIAAGVNITYRSCSTTRSRDRR
jgi:indolepyruvate ferredoxin oxidoreductase